MDIRRCLEILELDHNPSPAAIRQAYKDLVNVWHPDRFIHNQRLREKAEKKLKDINAAYHTLIAQSRSGTGGPEPQTHNSGNSENQEKEKAASKQPGTAPAGGNTERKVELGTRALLTLCYSLYKGFNRAVADLRDQPGQAPAQGRQPDISSTQRSQKAATEQKVKSSH